MNALTHKAPETLSSWQHVFRKAIHNLLTLDQMEALRIAVQNDDPRLLQGATTTPPPLQCVQDWPVEAACGLSYPFAFALGGFDKHADGSRNDNAATVAEVEEAFARICYEIDELMGEPAAVRWFLCWFDDTSREEMRRLLLPEVLRSLSIKCREQGEWEQTQAREASKHQ